MNTPIQEAAIEPQPKGPVMLVCFACAKQVHTVQLPPFVTQMLGGLRLFYCENDCCLHFGVITVGTREKELPLPPPPAQPAPEPPVVPAAVAPEKKITKRKGLQKTKK